MPDAAAHDVTEAIAQLLVDVAARPMLLEVGVGTGRIAVPLATAGVRVIGIDVSRDMLARLGAKSRAVAAVVADAVAPPLRIASVDGALFVHLLHLVPDPIAVVRAARAVVRPRGVLLLGRTEYAASLRDPVLDLVWTTLAEIGGPERPADPHAAASAAFEAVAVESRARVDTRILARWTEHATGRRVLDDLAARVYSSTWAIPDAVMTPLLARLELRLEALLGDLDRPYAADVAFALVVARLP